MSTGFRLQTVAACAVLLAGASGAKSRPGVQVDVAELGIFKALPPMMDSASNPITEPKVALGRMLYYEARLSKGQDISCNTCHALTAYGVEEESVSTGHKGQKGTRNAPTVYNAAGHFSQFWDGRAPTVEEQAKGPILNPIEMAMPDQKRALAVLKSMPEYVAAFGKAFPGEKNPVSYDNVGKAIGAFERRLVTSSRWDKFLGGEWAALTDPEKAGLNKYLQVGCQTCHSGIYLGGSMFQRLGAVKPWEEVSDLGRFALTKQEADKMVFKVPTLRNVEKTAPYYHDGSVKTLEDAVSRMAEHQLGKDLSAADVASITTFLKALTGELPVDYIKQPALPKSTAKTPKPDKT
jgi:cytochrome c peroxidase